jgi:hypothetical protein
VLSTTQIELGLSCERKLALKYWGKKFDIYPPEPDPSKPDSRPLGIEMHGVAEDYLIKGAQPDRLTQAGEMFIQGLKFLPPPGSGHVEGEFVFKLLGLEFGGLIDYWGPLDNFGCDPKTGTGGHFVKRVVTDHKTTKNAEKYGLWSKDIVPEHKRPNKNDPRKLVTIPEAKGFLQNPQSIIYSLYDLIRHGEDEAYLRWIYYRSVRPFNAVCSDMVLSKAEVLEAYGKLIHPVAERIEQLKCDTPHPLSLDPNPNACNDYGGCEWQTVCNLSPLQKLKGALGAPVKEKGIIMDIDLVARAKADIARKKGLASGAPPAMPAAGATATAADIANPPEARAAAPAPAPAPKPAPAPAPLPRPVPTPAPAPKAASIPAPAAVPASIPAPAAKPAAKLMVDQGVLAIFADRFGDALKLIAEDLRK